MGHQGSTPHSTGDDQSSCSKRSSCSSGDGVSQQLNQHSFHPSGEGVSQQQVYQRSSHPSGGRMWQQLTKCSSHFFGKGVPHLPSKRSSLPCWDGVSQRLMGQEAGGCMDMFPTSDLAPPLAQGAGTSHCSAPLMATTTVLATRGKSLQHRSDGRSVPTDGLSTDPGRSSHTHEAHTG